MKFCPFCSWEHSEVCTDKDRDDPPRYFYYVFCNHCEASGPTDYDRERAIQLWEERHTEPREFDI